MAKIVVHARTKYIHSGDQTEIDIPDEDLEGLEGVERERAIDEWALDELWNLIEWGWYEKD